MRLVYRLIDHSFIYNESMWVKVEKGRKQEELRDK